MKFVKKYRLVDADSLTSPPSLSSSSSASSPPPPPHPPLQRATRDPLEPPAVTEARETKRAIDENLARTDTSASEQVLAHNQLAGQYRGAVREATATQSRLDQVLTKLLEKLSGEEHRRGEQQQQQQQQRQQSPHPFPHPVPPHPFDDLAPATAKRRRRDPLPRSSPGVTRRGGGRKTTTAANSEGSQGVPLTRWTTRI